MAACNSKPKYVHEIKYSVRQKLCNMLDNGAWKDLAGELNYGADEIDSFSLAFKRQSSPTDELLRDWGHRNSKIDHLYRILNYLNLTRPMSFIEDIVSVSVRQKIQSERLVASQTCAQFGVSTNGRDGVMSTTGELPTPSQQRQMQPTGNSPFKKPYKELDPSDSYENVNFDPPSLNGGAMSTKNSVYQDKHVDGNPLPAHSDKHVDGNLLAAHIDERSERLPAGVLKTPENHVKIQDCPSGKSEDSSDHLKSNGLPQFLYDDILKVTYNFSEECLLGDGGFGKVYKAKLKQTLFAIKRLKPREDAAEQNRRKESFLSEMTALVSFVHVNIIQLCGVSNDGPEICLLYDFMQNGSLEDRLMCKGDTAPLSWMKRHHTLTGSAKGIQYLHTLRDKPLIHGDIKSANILLDRHWEPKIADFGLAKEATGGMGGKYTHVSRKSPREKVYGSRAYLPDEFLKDFELNIKTDSWSFGIVIFETCLGKEAYDERREGGKRLKDYVDNSFDPTLATTPLLDERARDWPKTLWMSLMDIGMKCTSTAKRDRPALTEVLPVLERIEEDGESMLKKQEDTSSKIGFHRDSFESHGEGWSLECASPMQMLEPPGAVSQVVLSSGIQTTAGKPDCLADHRIPTTARKADSLADHGYIELTTSSDICDPSLQENQGYKPNTQGIPSQAELVYNPRTHSVEEHGAACGQPKAQRVVTDELLSAGPDHPMWKVHDQSKISDPLKEESIPKMIQEFFDDRKVIREREKSVSTDKYLDEDVKLSASTEEGQLTASFENVLNLNKEISVERAESVYKEQNEVHSLCDTVDKTDEGAMPINDQSVEVANIAKKDYPFEFESSELRHKADKSYPCDLQSVGDTGVPSSYMHDVFSQLDAESYTDGYSSDSCSTSFCHSGGLKCAVSNESMHKSTEDCSLSDEDRALQKNTNTETVPHLNLTMTGSLVTEPKSTGPIYNQANNSVGDDTTQCSSGGDHGVCYHSCPVSTRENPPSHNKAPASLPEPANILNTEDLRRTEKAEQLKHARKCLQQRP